MIIRSDIQVLRGLAVLAVVLYHSALEFFPNGYLGVDVFFTISGFVIAPKLLEIFAKNQSRVNSFSKLIYFYKRRFFRLAPSLVSALLFSALIIFCFGRPGDHEMVAKQGIATILLLANVGAWSFSGDYFNPKVNPLIHTWSLSVEEQFYIIIPILLLLSLIVNNKCRKYSRNRISVFGVLLIITLLSFILFLNPNVIPIFNLSDHFNFYSVVPRFWQFTIGILGYIVINNKKIARINPFYSQLYILLLLLLIFGSFDLNFNLKTVCTNVCVILIIMSNSLEVHLKLINRLLIKIGDCSYSIYLFHMPLIYLAKFSPLSRLPFDDSRAIQSVVAFFSSFIVGYANYKLVEQKFRSKNYATYNLSFGFIAKITCLTFLLPTLVFGSIYFASQFNLFGIYQNRDQAPYAGHVDSNCVYDSEDGPPCFINHFNSANTALLIGDSHAGAISLAFVEASKKANLNSVVWTHAGCPILFKKLSNINISDTCIINNLKMKEWVFENQPDKIVISQFLRDLRLDPKASTVDQQFLELKNAILHLQSVSKKIIIIENNPIFPDGEDFMVPRPLVMPDYKAPKKFPRSEMQNVYKNVSFEFSFWAQSNSIQTANFTDIFCDSEFCNRFSYPNWLYHDIDHLSVFGAEKTVPELVKLLKN
jgi:peptidoglycan/LPS O-acetylase OafA/YrhL